MKFMSSFVPALAFAVLTSAAALAGGLESYSEKAYDQAHKDGKSVLLQFHQDGCGTCATQQETLAKLGEAPEGKLKVLVAKYEPGSGLARRFGVTSKSTLVLVRPPAKAVGITDEQAIRKFAE